MAPTSHLRTPAIAIPALLLQDVGGLELVVTFDDTNCAPRLGKPAAPLLWACQPSATHVTLLRASQCQQAWCEIGRRPPPGLVMYRNALEHGKPTCDQTPPPRHSHLGKSLSR